NLHAPGRGRPAGFSVIERGPTGESEVAFNSTEGTELEDERESEELRRLMYVAVTRARDRLYFAAEVGRNGLLKRGTRSLASLLPAELAGLFTTLSKDAEREWTSAHGVFAFAACRPDNDRTPAEPGPEGDTAAVPFAVDAASAGPATAPVGAAEVAAARPAAITEPAEDRVMAPVELIDPGRKLISASMLDAPTLAGMPARPARAADAERDHDERIVGTLVHRMLQRRLDPAATDDSLLREAGRLLRREQLVDVDDVHGLAREALRIYRSLRSHPELVAALGAGTCLYEVPFSYEPPDRPGERVRGVVDCLVVAPDGRAVILEFKTGLPRPEHEAQAGLYAAAMSQALGQADVEVKIVYATGHSATSGPGQIDQRDSV
ncbi:MAG: PD-(D/E)XK nuclease family protein, partial [Acidobacteriota bacterium]